MKNMTEFTEAQLEVMSKEKSPRGRKARLELERRKKMFNGEKVPSEKTQKALDEIRETVYELIKDTEEKPKPKRTRRKPTTKKSEED